MSRAPLKPRNSRILKKGQAHPAGNLKNWKISKLRLLVSMTYWRPPLKTMSVHSSMKKLNHYKKLQSLIKKKSNLKRFRRLSNNNWGGLVSIALQLESAKTAQSRTPKVSVRIPQQPPTSLSKRRAVSLNRNISSPSTRSKIGVRATPWKNPKKQTRA
jgi:hypothetical protein